jgi:hypothetical protein
MAVKAGSPVFYGAMDVSKRKVLRALLSNQGKILSN